MSRNLRTQEYEKNAILPVRQLQRADSGTERKTCKLHAVLVDDAVTGNIRGGHSCPEVAKIKIFSRSGRHDVLSLRHYRIYTVLLRHVNLETHTNQTKRSHT